MFQDILTPQVILALAKVTAILLATFVISPFIKHPGLRSSLWTTAILALPLVILLSSSLSIFQLIPSQEGPIPKITNPEPAAPLITPLETDLIFSEEFFAFPDSEPLPIQEIITNTQELQKSTTPFPWLPVIYLFGASLVILPILLSQLRIRLLKKSHPSGKPHELWQTLNFNHQLKAQLYFTPSPSAPFASGILKPAILIPHESQTWSPTRLQSTLLHEVAHLKRRDPLTRFLSSLVKALLWFHPLLWLAHRQLIAAQEQACDQHALTAGIEPQDYAADLLRSASLAHTTPSQALNFARWSQIGNRIRHILNSKNHYQTTMKKIASICAFVSLSALVISSIGFAKQPPSETTTEADKDSPNSPHFTSTQPSSTATVQIHPASLVLPIGNKDRTLMVSQNYIQNECENIVATKALKLAAQDLKIDLKKDKNAIADLKRKIRTAPRRGTDFIDIIAYHDDRKEATKIANAVTNAYIKHRNGIELARTNKALAVLDNELKHPSDIVQKHRKNLTSLIQKYGIPYFDGNKQNQLGSTEQEMFQNARLKLANFQTQRDQLEIQITKLIEMKNEDLVAYTAGLDLPENQVTRYFTQHREAIDARKKKLAHGLATHHPDIRLLDDKAKVAMENARKEAISLKAVLKTKSELVNRQVKRMEEMVKNRNGDSKSLALKQHAYTQAKETYEMSQAMLRELKTKQQETRTLLQMPRDPVTLHEKAH